ncbi:MAG: Hint domain-containing protein [Sulfitobacter sp.]
MPDYTFKIYRLVDIGGSPGFEIAGEVTIRDDDGNRDDILDDIEQAGVSETNGDQEIIASTVSELSVGDTFRARGENEMTNTETGETFDNVIDVFSETAGIAVETLYIFTAPPPSWFFDTTNRTRVRTNADGTTPYADIACFTRGTMIRITGGMEVPIEELNVGDCVLCDRGKPRRIKWIGSTEVCGYRLMTKPNLRPIRIRAGALGTGYPNEDLEVSQQHRVLVRSKIAERMFGETDVLVPAKKLLELDGVDVADEAQKVEYFHILLDEHRLIVSNGALTESLLTGPHAMEAVGLEARAEIEELFPEVTAPDFCPVPARLVPKKGKEIKQLLARHAKNDQPLFARL